MELFIYSGQAELPSIDFDCLRTVAYCKFNGIPVKISTNGNPFHSPNGFLPYLKDNAEIVAGYDEIISYFQSKGFGAEEYISSSYLSQFETQLLPYFTYVLWGDPANTEPTRIMYSKKVPFPFNFVYPQKYINRASDFLNIVANFSISEKLEHHNTADLILNAKKYVNMLAERIEKKRWFFGGQKPGEFDATIYAALSVLLFVKLPNNDLKSHINECPHLVSFVERIRKKYLADLRVTVENVPKEKTVFDRVQRVFVNKEKGTLSNTVIKVMFGLVTISSMVFFAVSHGIVEFVTDSDDIESIQYYDDNSKQYDDD